jgi:alpha-galactosidase
MKDLTRREMLRLAMATPLAAAISRLDIAKERRDGFVRQTLVNAASKVVTANGTSAKQIKITRKWEGPLCRSRLVNTGKVSAPIKEVVLFDLALPFASETRLYGEGFQMLTQTGGTLGTPADLGNYTDAKHYKLRVPEAGRTLYGMMTLAPPEGGNFLLAFTSCRRFSGQFYLVDRGVQVVVDTEGLELKPGEAWDLEEFTFESGPERERLLENLAHRIARNHPRLPFRAPPTGWCSWYCFGPRVTAQQVLDNLDFIAKQSPGLKYIQIDDGYQPAMGDWLETGTAFGGNVQSVLKEIRARGFEPAIWVAPFVAEEKSHVFAQHPEWFVKDNDGSPLRSDRVTFGGWRHGPWYVLDGTHPQVQAHFV